MFFYRQLSKAFFYLRFCLAGFCEQAGVCSVGVHTPVGFDTGVFKVLLLRGTF